MPKYLVSWSEENFYNITIDADSEFSALAKFHNHEFDYEDSVLVSSQLQASIDVEEV